MTSNPSLYEQQTAPLNRERAEADATPETLVPGEIRTLQAKDGEQALFRISDAPLSGNTEPDLFNFHTNDDGEWVLESTGINPEEAGGQWKIPKDVEFTIGDQGIYMRLRDEQTQPRLMGVNTLPLVAQRLVAHALHGQGNRAITLSAFDSISAEGQSLTLRNTGGTPLALETHVVAPELGTDTDATQPINAELIKGLDNAQRNVAEVTAKDGEEEKVSGTSAEAAATSAPLEENPAVVEPDVEQAEQAPMVQAVPEEAPVQAVVETSEPAKEEPSFRLQDTGDFLGTQVRVREDGPSREAAPGASGDIPSRLGSVLEGEDAAVEATEVAEEEPERKSPVKLDGLTPAEAGATLKDYATRNLETMSKTVTEKMGELTEALKNGIKLFNPVQKVVFEAIEVVERELKGQSQELSDTVEKIKDYVKAEEEREAGEIEAIDAAERHLVLTTAKQMEGYLATMDGETSLGATELKKMKEQLDIIAVRYSDRPDHAAAQKAVLQSFAKLVTALTERKDVRAKIKDSVDKLV